MTQLQTPLSNAARSNRFEVAMLALRDLYEFELPTMLTDLLVDARHWCDKHNESYWDADQSARRHYLAELAEEWSRQ